MLAGLYLGLGVHPYRFVIYIAYMMIYPSFNVIILIFASRKPFGATPSSSDLARQSKDRQLKEATQTSSSRRMGSSYTFNSQTANNSGSTRHNKEMVVSLH
jgi:hypothetical protein